MSEAAALPCRTAIVTEVRAPHTHLAEWLQYHKAVGFDRIYLYCADSDPSLCFMLVSGWCEIGFVRFVHAPKPRHPVGFFGDFARQHATETSWVILLYTHEFLCLPQAGTIGRFLDDVPTYWDCVQFNLLPIGARLLGPDDGAILPRCTHAAKGPTPVLRPLTRSDRIVPLGAQSMTDDSVWLCWHERVAYGTRCFDVLGRLIEFYYVNYPLDVLTYLADDGVRSRMLSRGVVCRVLPPDPERDAGETAQLAELTTSTPFPYLRAQAVGVMQRHIRRVPMPQVDPSRGPNLALGQPALQSSVSGFSLGATPAADAAGAVSGLLTGGFQFHTDIEDEPWWMVDLGGLVELREIHVHNRLDVGGFRAARLSFRVSVNGSEWHEIYRRTDPTPWGQDGLPLVWTANTSIVMRHLRLVLLGRECLHLDQVEVYGVRRRADWFYL